MKKRKRKRKAPKAPKAAKPAKPKKVKKIKEVPQAPSGTFPLTYKQAQKIADHTAPEQMRYALNTIFVRGEKNKITMVATDGKRMCVVAVPAKSDKFEKMVSVDNFLNIARGGNGFVKIESILNAEAIEGTYPKFEDVVPKNVPNLMFRYCPQMQAVQVETGIGFNAAFVVDGSALVMEMFKDVDVVDFYGNKRENPFVARYKRPNASVIVIVSPLSTR